MKILVFLPVKKIHPCVKKPLKVPVKMSECPWKFWKKCAWKTVSFREKSPKNAKNLFHAHFFFHVEKKNTGLDARKISGASWPYQETLCAFLSCLVGAILQYEQVRHISVCRHVPVWQIIYRLPSSKWRTLPIFRKK